MTDSHTDCFRQKEDAGNRSTRKEALQDLIDLKAVGQ